MLADALAEGGWSVWWDPRIPTGKTYRQVITGALANARCVVVLWTQHSVNSRWVQEEAEEGLRKGALVPVMIGNLVEAPLGFRSIQAARLVESPAGLSSENRSVVEQLLADIADLIGPGPEALAPVPTITEPSSIIGLLHDQSEVSEQRDNAEAICTATDQPPSATPTVGLDLKVGAQGQHVESVAPTAPTRTEEGPQLKPETKGPAAAQSADWWLRSSAQSWRFS